MALLPSSLRCCAVAAELPSSGPPLLRRQPRSPAGASSAVRRAVAARAAAGDKSRAEQVLEMQRRLLDQIEERKRLHDLLVKGMESDADSSVAEAPAPAHAPPPSGPRAGARKAAAATGGPPRSARPPVRRMASAAAPATQQEPPAAPQQPPQPQPTVWSVRPSAVAAAAEQAALQAESCVLPNAEVPAVPKLKAAAADTPDVAEPHVVAPPPPCKERLNVVMVAMECAPWSKTGGLGDVAGALPKALARRGHRTMCVAPRYANYAEGWETGVRIQLTVCGVSTEVGFFHGFIDGVDYVFVDHPCFHAHKDRLYGGAREDLLFRCALLCQAALEAPWVVPCGGVPYGDQNLVFLANDWHTALLPVFLQGFYRDHGKLTFARCCLVVHNMAHQGRGPLADFDRLGLAAHWRDAFALNDPMGGLGMNIFKAGILSAQRLVAVSEGYAWECTTDMGGWGLAPTLNSVGWKMSGIVNGIDLEEWNPATDVHLQNDGYVNYTPDAQGLLGKAACKAALQKQLGLPVRPEVPLIGFIGRLDYQKGVDLICQSADHLVSQGAQLVMLGSGTSDLENALRGMEHRHQDSARGWVGFSVSMAHRITAGADILLMPSRFEPCGLNQLYAMRYGTVPVVHAVGGLRDTVTPFNPFENAGTGWTFSPAEADRMNEAVGNAVYTYRSFPDSFRGIQLRGMAQDLSWEVAAQKYEDVMLAAKYQW